MENCSSEDLGILYKKHEFVFKLQSHFMNSYSVRFFILYDFPSFIDFNVLFWKT